MWADAWLEAGEEARSRSRTYGRVLRWVWVAAYYLVFAAIFPPLYMYVGLVAAALSIPTVILGAWFGGKRAGVGMALAVFILNGLLFESVGVSFSTVVTFHWPALLVMVGLGASVGWMSNLRCRLEEREALLLLTLARIDDPVVMTDRMARITYVNPAFERVTGWRKNEVLGLTPRILKSGHMPADFYKRMWGTLRSGQVFRAEFVNVRRTGELYYSEQSVSPMFDASGAISGYVGVGRDTTDRKMTERERVKTAKLESVGVLAGGIAHDFNNILTVVIGNLSLALREVERGSEAHTLLTQAESASRRAKGITKQLLTFARGGTPVRRVLDLAGAVPAAAEFSARGAKVRCRFRMGVDVWPVEADPAQIQQVVHNLVLNAAQALPEGGDVLISLANEERSGTDGLPLEPGRYVRLEVEDRGAGISEENLSKVFDPYFTTRPAGSGLGLAVCHSIVKNHRGHIGIRSRAGRGTTVTVHLPATEKQLSPAAAFPEGTLQGRGRILVMDDEEAVRAVAARMLKVLGYEVEMADEGRRAVELYAARMGNGGAFDAVLVDLTVPGGLGGNEAAGEILKLDPAAQILVSSGYSDDPVLARHEEYGFKGRVPKPYTLSDLGRALRDVLADSSDS